MLAAGKGRIVLLVCFCLLIAVPALAAEPTAGGYLAGYETVDPRPTSTSFWSTLAYFISLLAVFAFVVLLAYFASRFLSGHFGKITATDGGRLLLHLPLGPNRSVCVVELAERVFMLGVTEHSITLLREITDEDEIERLHRRSLGGSGGVGNDFPLSDQLGSLEQLAKRIPSLFRDRSYRG